MEIIGPKYGVHPLVRWVRGLAGDFLLRREVARSLGISDTALDLAAAAHPDLRLGPSHTAQYGALTVYLYDPPRVERLWAYFADEQGSRRRKAGRPRIWSVSEARLRDRKQDRARYYRRCSRTSSGTARREYLERAAAIAQELDDQRAERMRELSANCP